MSQYPVAWILLFFVGLLKFNISFLPIVMLALVFNLTNSIGYTYAVRFIALISSADTEQDKDSKKKWASGMASSSLLGGMGGMGGSIVGGLAQGVMGKVFG